MIDLHNILRGLSLCAALHSGVHRGLFRQIRPGSIPSISLVSVPRTPDPDAWRKAPGRAPVEPKTTPGQAVAACASALSFDKAGLTDYSQAIGRTIRGGTPVTRQLRIIGSRPRYSSSGNVRTFNGDRRQDQRGRRSLSSRYSSIASRSDAGPSWSSACIRVGTSSSGFVCDGLVALARQEKE